MISNSDQATTRPGVILSLLFLANLMNFFDRTIPAIVVEPIRFEWWWVPSPTSWPSAP